MSKKEIETFYPESQADWRRWLEENHQSKQSIWLIYYRQSTNKPSLSWSEAVDEALCFGWIDSTKKTIDKERYMQYFTKRKPGSTWSKVNKDKVAQLIDKKLMMKAGFDSIQIAKENGTWSLLDDVENLIVPEDLRCALNKHKSAMEFFESQSKTIRKGMLYWVTVAKRPETRKKRITEIVKSAANGEKPDHFR
ncbi:YdeI/OmpD-associated family protein [bacterium SCSIO 12643]|nr:YdeI/OmpD-associated family protein [bacterium SCSIO 12643]